MKPGKVLILIVVSVFSGATALGLALWTIQKFSSQSASAATQGVADVAADPKPGDDPPQLLLLRIERKKPVQHGDEKFIVSTPATNEAYVSAAITFLAVLEAQEPSVTGKSQQLIDGGHEVTMLLAWPHYPMEELTMTSKGVITIKWSLLPTEKVLKELLLPLERLTVSMGFQPHDLAANPKWISIGKETTTIKMCY